MTNVTGGSKMTPLEADPNSRNEAASEEPPPSALIAAAQTGIIAKSTPKLKATIYDSVQLAVLVWRELQSRGSLPTS